MIAMSQRINIIGRIRAIPATDTIATTGTARKMFVVNALQKNGRERRRENTDFADHAAYQIVNGYVHSAEHTDFSDSRRIASGREISEPWLRL